LSRAKDPSETKYAWTDHDLPESITESDESKKMSTGHVEFAYDARKRQRRGTRSEGVEYEYHLAYTCDNRGNRTVKTDLPNNLRTDCAYDL
jgi:hypothetical protein